jgi:probable F420-dependent oxidoreductase
MQFGVVVPSYGPFGDAAAIRDIVDAAEGLGYDTAWFGDHIVIPSYAAHVSAPRWFDALSCCIFGAGRTWRLRFGTDVLVLPYRPPVVLSQLVASADQLCDGRLTLGVGVGYIRGEFAAVGAPPYAERGVVTDEYLEVLRLLWESEGPVSFSGRYVQIEDVIAAPEPRQRPFPLWVGGNNARALRRAAQHGSGWHPLFPTPEQYAAGRATITARRAELAHDGAFTFAYSCPETRVIFDDRDVRPSVSYEGLTDIPAEYSYAPPFPRDDAGRARFVGTPDEVVADVTAYADAGVEHLALRFWTGDPSVGAEDVIRQFEKFAEEVAPAFVPEG